MIFNDFISIGDHIRKARKGADEARYEAISRLMAQWHDAHAMFQPYLANAKSFHLDQPTSLRCAAMRNRPRPLTTRLPFERMTVSAFVPNAAGNDVERIGIILNVAFEEHAGHGGIGFILKDASGPLGTLPLLCSTFYFAIEDGVFELKPMDADGVAGADAERVVDIVNGLLWLMLRGNRHTAQPSNLRKTNIRRQLSGRRPLLEYSEIRVDQVDDEHEEVDGAVARTPCKEHDRRGHNRKLRDGRVIWVRECRVGDVRQGRVESRYVAGDTPGEDWKGGTLPAPRLITTKS